MTGSRLIVIVLVLIAALSALIPATPRVQAADVNIDLHAENFTWHVGTNTSASTTITVNQGDTIRLRIVSHDSVPHTFTAPQFSVDQPLSPFQTIFVNITTDASDVGTRQFYCIPHSTGTYPSRTGMVGSIVVQSTAPPPTPANNTLLYAGIGIVLVVIVVAVLAVMMRRKKPGGPGPGGPQQP